MLKVEELDLKNNYKEFCGWWESWGWKPFPLPFLPEEGIRVTNDGKNVCAVFIYSTQTPIYWIENYISDRDADKDVRNEALNMMIDAALEKAKAMGGKVAMSAVNSKSLKDRLEKKKFIKTDENLCGFARGL